MDPIPDDPDLHVLTSGPMPAGIELLKDPALRARLLALPPEEQATQLRAILDADDARRGWMTLRMKLNAVVRRWHRDPAGTLKLVQDTLGIPDLRLDEVEALLHAYSLTQRV
jgi:hypothetical protein